MQVKFELDKLPYDLRDETVKSLSITDIVNVATTSTKNLQFFKPLADTRKLMDYLPQLTRGNHESVREMLAKDKGLFYRKGKVTDYSGRTFENISGFEYALWALDKHMWTTILDCLPEDQEGNVILQILMGQYNNLDKNGITYSLNGQTITEKHFNFEQTIITELVTHINMIVTLKNNVISIYNANSEDLNAISKQWGEDVRRAQKLFPMHVVYEYCSIDEPFSTAPKFTLQPKSSPIIFNCLKKEQENWFSPESEPESWSGPNGSHLAIYKSLGKQRGQGACAGSDCFTSHWASLDLSFIQELYTVRTDDFINLKSQLEEKMELYNQQTVKI